MSTPTLTHTSPDRERDSMKTMRAPGMQIARDDQKYWRHRFSKPPYTLVVESEIVRDDQIITVTNGIMESMYNEKISPSEPDPRQRLPPRRRAHDPE